MAESAGGGRVVENAAGRGRGGGVMRGCVGDGCQQHSCKLLHLRRRLLALSFHLLHHYSGSVGDNCAGSGLRDIAETGTIVAAPPSHGPQFQVFLFQGLCVCGHGVVILRGGAGCGRRWGIFGGETGSIVFPEGGGRFEPGALCCSF